MKTHLILFAASFTTGCQLWGGAPPDPECRDVVIDVPAELMITDRTVRGDASAQNAGFGALSFSGQLGAVGRGTGNLDVQALAGLVKVSPSELASARTPFRLLAVVNRTDLAAQLLPECPAGEARLSYTLTDGPGDDPSSSPLPLTVIWEYCLGTRQSAAEWARRFHELGARGLGTAPYRAALSALISEIQEPENQPGAPFLSQVRVNDAQGGEPVFHELVVAGEKLELRGLRNSPREEFAGSLKLRAFAIDHASEIREGTHRVPKDWLGISATGEIDWKLTDAAPDVIHAFERGTCAGCHGKEGPGREGFHVAESPAGDVVLSRFLLEEDLDRRSEVAKKALCAGGQGGP